VKWPDWDYKLFLKRINMDLIRHIQEGTIEKKMTVTLPLKIMINNRQRQW
jgi:hypothetical protein